MKTVLCFSGGLDSTVLLYWLLSQGHLVRCLGVDYGQRHMKELGAARGICNYAGVEFKVASLRSLLQFLGGSSQTDNVPVPLGHYAEESMKATVVPNRNMILLSVATAWAISTKSDCVAYAAHAGDHTIYPDCRPEFAKAMSAAIALADWHKVAIERPFITKTKADIVRLGADLKAPLHLTWSCYQGREHHCGECGTCVERREAFQLAGVPDPTLYVPSSFSQKGV